MRRTRFLLTLVALTATTFVAASAGAQDTTVSKGEVARASTFNSLVAAVNMTPASLEAIKAKAEIQEGEVRLINATPLVEGQDETSLKAALDQHATQLEELRTALGSKAGVTAALEKQMPKATVADVIAVEVHVDGSVDVYYRPQGT